MPCSGMLQEFEMFCQNTISFIKLEERKEGGDGRKGGKMEKEKRTFAYFSRRCPLLSVIATDRSHCRSTLELVAGYTRVPCSVFVFRPVDCFDRVGNW